MTTTQPLPTGNGGRAQGVPLATLFLATFTLSATVFFFAPAQVYFTNAREFGYVFSRVAGLLGAATAGAAAVLTAILAPTRRWAAIRPVAILVTAAWLCWAQSALIVTDYGPLDGRPIAWEVFRLERLLGYVLLATGFGLAVALPRLIARHAVAACTLLLLMEAAGLAQLAASAPPPDVGKLYAPSAERQFAFSNHRNVVVIALDMFQSDVFDDIVASDPAFSRHFDGFVRFRDTLGGFGATFGALTFMLTGQLYDNSTPLPAFIEEAFLSETSIPARLKREGFDVSLHTTAPHFILLDPRVVSNLEPRRPLTWREAGRLLDLGLFRCLPHDGKRWVFAENSWRLQRLMPDRPVLAAPASRFAGRRSGRFSEADLNLFEANHIVEPRWVSEMEQQGRVDAGPPVFRFYHLRGPHYPLRMNERMAFETLSDDRVGYTRQARGSLEAVVRFLERLERARLYDNTLIVVAGDHGYRGPLDGLVLGVRPPQGVPCAAPAEPRSGFTHPNQKGSALPLLLVKPFNRRGALTHSDAAVSLGDLPATVLGELGLRQPAGGRSVFEAVDPLRRRRFVQDAMIAPRADGYYPAMREFEVRGPAWCDASWRETRSLPPHPDLHEKATR